LETLIKTAGKTRSAKAKSNLKIDQKFFKNTPNLIIKQQQV